VVRLERIGHNGIFALHLVMPPKARIEYTFGINYASGEQEIRPDPRNPRLAWCPFGPKSVVTTEFYCEPDWTLHDPQQAKGQLNEFDLYSLELASHRRFWIYTPATPPPPAGYPLLLVHDGNDYLDYSGIQDALDNLIGNNLIAPVLVALTKPENRNEEYSCTREHPAYLMKELAPWIRERYPVSRRREDTALMGASFGAVASIYAAYNFPDDVGLLFLQSGSFVFQHVVRATAFFEPIDEFDRITHFLESDFFPAGPKEHMRIYHSCGTFETILSYNRSFANELSAAGHEINYRESHDGHNWISWRDHFKDGLRYLFPPNNQPADGAAEEPVIAGHI